MKRFTKVMNLVAVVFALTLVCVLGTSVEAATAKFKSGTVYVFPGTSQYDCPTTTKQQYYSVKKYRMDTYSNRSITVVYPKDTPISVSSSKKSKLEATITSTKNEDIYGETDKTNYVKPNATYFENALLSDDEVTGVYYVSATQKYYKKNNNGVESYTYKEVSPVALNYYGYYYVEDANHADGGYWTSSDIYKEVATGKYYLQMSVVRTNDKYNYTFSNPVTPYVLANDGDCCIYKYVKDNTVCTTRSDMYIAPNGTYCRETTDDNGKTVFEPVTLIAYEAQYYMEQDASGNYVDAHYLTVTDNGTYYYTDDNVTEYYNYQKVVYDDGKTPDYEYAVSTIQLTSTTAGKYSVTIKTGSKKTKVDVLVNKFGNSVYTQAKLGSSTVYKVTKKDTANNTTTTYNSNSQVSSKLKTAKLKLTANKNFKITGVVTAYIDKDGKAKYKKGKNGASIPLTQAYDYESKWGANGSKSKRATKSTFVYISYKDTFDKTACTYSVVKKNGVKKIKEVYKSADGKSRTNYYDYGDGGRCTMSLWSY